MEPIVACVTPWGHAAIAVVRLSGEGLAPVIARVCGRLPEAWTVCRVSLRDDDGVFDDGLLSWFPAPRSYTGEDVAEVSCHGNPLLVERLVRAFGVRPARPGEFTRRAFLHGKLDLARAQAVQQAIDATSARGLAVARAGLDGVVSGAAGALADRARDVAAELEAILDHPGEDLLFRDDAELVACLDGIVADAERIAGTFSAGRTAVQGARVALVGPPNAGKSSLFNALLGRERALVSDVPGTTRDVVESPLQLDAVRIILLDTAGERRTEDALEAAGIAHAARAREEADLVVHCVPVHEEGPLPDGFVVGTFGDLPAVRHPALVVCAKTGAGLDTLRAALVRRLGGEAPGGAAVVLADAHQHALFAGAAAHVRGAAEDLVAAGPAVAAERLYAAIEALAAVGGTDVRESVLDRLFARFCVGK